jgi:uncharacterized membrane protein YagU involved in acid resistance
MNFILVLATFLGLVVAVKIRVLSRTHELLQTESTARSVKVTQTLTGAYIWISFHMNQIHELDISPQDQTLYKLYGYEKVSTRRPRASGVIGHFVSIYWMIVLLPAKQKTRLPEDWLAQTGFSDVDQDTFERWYNNRSIGDDYTVALIDVQIPEWHTHDDSKNLPILDVPKSAMG